MGNSVFNGRQSVKGKELRDPKQQMFSRIRKGSSRHLIKLSLKKYLIKNNPEQTYVFA
jgi:hypothetical protein